MLFITAHFGVEIILNNVVDGNYFPIRSKHVIFLTWISKWIDLYLLWSLCEFLITV